MRTAVAAVLFVAAACVGGGRATEAPLDGSAVPQESATDGEAAPSEPSAFAADGTPVDGSLSPADRGGTDEELPPVCPPCRPNRGGQTGDFVVEPPTQHPLRPLTSEEAQRFGIDDLRSALTRTFSQLLVWTALAGDPAGEARDETAIEGELSLLDEFLYDERQQSIRAPTSLRFSTADGRLASQATGTFELKLEELGWPQAGPTLGVFVTADLATVRGTLEVPTDPTKVQGGAVEITLTLTPDSVFGRLRVGLLDDGVAEHQQVAAGFFPGGECGRNGGAMDVDEPRNVLDGGSWAEVFAQAPLSPGTYHVEATWEEAGHSVGVVVELPGVLGAPACEDIFRLDFPAQARLRTEDGQLDLLLEQGSMGVVPYSSTLRSLSYRDAQGDASLRFVDEPETQPAWQGHAELTTDGVVVDTLSFRLCDGECD